MFDEVKMRCFIELAHTLNFSRAAKQLFLTQQAVSKNIAMLEKEWGVKLFNRNTRNVSLTKEGKELYEIVYNFSNNISSAIERIKLNQNASTLRVGYQNFLMINDVVHSALQLLKETAPEITLDGNRYAPPILNELLQSKTLEMIIIYERFLYHSDAFESLELAIDPQYLIVAENYPYESFDDILRAPFIIDNFEGQRSLIFEERVKHEIKEFGLNPSDIIVVSDRDSAYTYAELGRGVMIGAGQSHIGSGRKLKRFETNHIEKLLAVWQKDEKNPLISKYTSFLIEGFKEKT